MLYLIGTDSWLYSVDVELDSSGVMTMPQVSLYIDDEVLDKARKSAQIKKISLSKYITQKLIEQHESGWPEGYWDLFGSITDETFVEPEDQPIGLINEGPSFS